MSSTFAAATSFVNSKACFSPTMSTSPAFLAMRKEAGIYDVPNYFSPVVLGRNRND